MKIVVPNEIEQKLINQLKKADKREIGGILMGEHLSEGVFRIKAVTVQGHTGTYATFVRVVKDIINPLRRFFYETNHHYTRFNYLGEWHSHPSFVPRPSKRDNETMWSILDDPQTGANFAVLLIVRLTKAGELEGTATVYLPERTMFEAELLKEEEEINHPTTLGESLHD
jgi:proteasome lid subunit RPN8/RPN11